jgi:hypothetical protein
MRSLVARAARYSLVVPAVKLDDAEIKHLEFIQNVIARLATDSFLMKGWGLTVAGAFFGFSAKDLNWRLAAVGLLPVIAFWCLDAYFLSRERLFRDLYIAVRTGTPAVDPFDMNYTAFMRSGWTDWWCSFRSRTIWPFYLAILLVGVTLIFFGATSGPDRPSGCDQRSHPQAAHSSAHFAARCSQ